MPAVAGTFPCPVCAYPNKEKSHYCNDCGAEIIVRCQICAAQVTSNEIDCHHCGFNLAQTRYAAVLTPDLIPKSVEQRVINSLNAHIDPTMLWKEVPLLGETDTGVDIAKLILDAKP